MENEKYEHQEAANEIINVLARYDVPPCDAALIFGTIISACLEAAERGLKNERNES